MSNHYENKDRREFILKLATLSGAISLTLSAPQLFADKPIAKLTSAKLKTSKGVTKLIIGLDKTAKHSVFTLQSPDRVVIDLINAHTVPQLKLTGNKNSFIKGLRHAQRNENDLRLVLDLTKSAKVTSAYKGNTLEITLKPGSKKSSRKASRENHAIALKKLLQRHLHAAPHAEENLSLPLMQDTVVETQEQLAYKVRAKKMSYYRSLASLNPRLTVTPE